MSKLIRPNFDPRTRVYAVSKPFTYAGIDYEVGGENFDANRFNAPSRKVRALYEMRRLDFVGEAKEFSETEEKPIKNVQGKAAVALVEEMSKSLEEGGKFEPKQYARLPKKHRVSIDKVLEGVVADFVKKIEAGEDLDESFGSDFPEEILKPVDEALNAKAVEDEKDGADESLKDFS